MTFYGKLTGALCATAIIGTTAASIAAESSEVLAQAQALADECSCYVIGEYEGKVALFNTRFEKAGLLAVKEGHVALTEEGQCIQRPFRR